jgi:hypothetical protein
MHGIPPIAPSEGYGEQEPEQWPRYDGPSNQDSRWSSGTDDSDEDEDDSPDPTHECVNCGTGSYIESEIQKNTPHFCDDCGSVTRHQKV